MIKHIMKARKFVLADNHDNQLILPLNCLL